MTQTELCPGCKGQKYYPTDLWESGTVAAFQPCAICCREEHMAFWAATDDNERINWFFNKKLREPAKCEIRPREAVFRKWDESKGYFAHVPTTMHEVFVDGEPEAVAASDNLKVAEAIVVMLSAVLLQDVPAVLKAISAPALTRSYAMRRGPRPHQPQFPFERHSIAS